MPAITSSTIKSVSYEFDRDTQTWTQRKCTTKTLQLREMETVCYKETIPAPPPAVVTLRGKS